MLHNFETIICLVLSGLVVLEHPLPGHAKQMRMNLTPRNETFAQSTIIKELKHLLKKKGIVLKRRFSRDALSTEVSEHFDKR